MTDMTDAPVPPAELPTADELDAAVSFLWPLYTKEVSRAQFAAGSIQCQRLAVAFRHYAEQQIEPWRSKLAEQCEKHLVTLQQHERAMAALRAIKRRANYDGTRTFDDVIDDITWIDDECRRALAALDAASPAGETG